MLCNSARFSTFASLNNIVQEKTKRDRIDLNSLKFAGISYSYGLVTRQERSVIVLTEFAERKNTEFGSLLFRHGFTNPREIRHPLRCSANTQFFYSETTSPRFRKDFLSDRESEVECKIQVIWKIKTMLLACIEGTKCLISFWRNEVPVNGQRQLFAWFLSSSVRVVGSRWKRELWRHGSATTTKLGQQPTRCWERKRPPAFDCCITVHMVQQLRLGIIQSYTSTPFFIWSIA